MIQVCSDNMLWFAKFPGPITDGFMVVILIGAVSAHEISRFMC